ncbi:MAG: insulinase family protein [Clostridia bacterium]|nr:insulinase family protein [Clostridia bacterium]
MLNTDIHPLTHEKAVTFTHASGLTVTVLEKPLHTYYALLGTNFGSIHRDVTIDGLRYSLPDGTAHFLEHKLFDQPDGSDAFEKFAAIGADANAFTTYLSTACLFDCTDQFEEGLEVLLSFVTSAVFTEETVAKELPIIGEEIAADRDSPAETLYSDILKALYKHHPVRRPILGSRSTIAKLTPELLTTVHRAFYHPARLHLCVAGRITPEAVEAICDKVFSQNLPAAPSVEYLPPKEPREVAKSRTVRKMSVTQPTVALGIKLLPDRDEDIPKTAAALEVLGCLLFGESSALSHRLYREGVISSTLSFESTMNQSFGHLIVFANTDHPEETLTALKEALYRFTTPDDTDFLACKRMELGDLFQSMDSTEEYASDYLAHRMEGSHLFAYADALERLTPADISALAERLQSPNLTAEALVLPKR